MDKEFLLQGLIERYIRSHPRSESLFQKASAVLEGGGSHNLRLFSPFPFYDASCKGSKVTDVDDNLYVDFWQGHFANILGHNPKVVSDALKAYFDRGQGLATGFPGVHQSELASIILKTVKADKVRFTTSGTLATMYAVMLAKAYTERELVMKIWGGWHGAQPYTLKGISVFDKGLSQMESAGLPKQLGSTIVTTEFNAIEDLKEKFRLFGERVACLIIEPFIGAGGFLFGRNDYIQAAREISREYGTILIFDEVISGFRFHAGALHTLYGVDPDLSVFGKAIGGGMPVSAVAGKEEIMALSGQEAPPSKKVKFEGGTFSAHPASMIAGLTFLNYLIDNEQDIYPRIGRLGRIVRQGIEEIFTAEGFNVCCTGDGKGVTENSSVIGVHFLKGNDTRVESPEQVWNPDISDLELREKLFKLAMLEQGFNIFHGFGAISSAHSEEEIQASLDAVARVAKSWRANSILD